MNYFNLFFRSGTISVIYWLLKTVFTIVQSKVSLKIHFLLNKTALSCHSSVLFLCLPAAQRGKKSWFRYCEVLVLFLNHGSQHLRSKGVSCCFSPRRKRWLCIRTRQTSPEIRGKLSSAVLWLQWGNWHKFNGAVWPNWAVGVRLAVSAHLLWI